MKALICIPCLLTGGTEIQTLSLVRALILGGHEVVTVCYFEFSEQMISNYISAGSEVVCLQKDGLRIGGKAVIPFLYKGLKRVIKNFRPDVVHVQYMAPGAIPIFLLRFFGVKNIITTAHTFADIYSNLKLIHFIQKRIVRAFTCITLKAETSFFGTAILYDEKTKMNKRNHFTIYNTLPQYIKINNAARNYSSDLEIQISKLKENGYRKVLIQKYIKSSTSREIGITSISYLNGEIEIHDKTKNRSRLNIILISNYQFIRIWTYK